MSILALVDRGLQLHAEIKAREQELKAVEAKLAELALYKDQVPLSDPDREGSRYLAKGTSKIVPVVFTADKLIGSFKSDSPKHQEIVAAAGSHFGEFFTLVKTYESQIDDGKKFRLAAGSVLGPAAPAFITACLARDKHGIPKSDAKIVWGDAEPVGAQ